MKKQRKTYALGYARGSKETVDHFKRKYFMKGLGIYPGAEWYSDCGLHVINQTDKTIRLGFFGNNGMIFDFAQTQDEIQSSVFHYDGTTMFRFTNKKTGGKK